MTTPQERMRALTLNDLQAWAGRAVVGRGKNYVSRVQDLACLQDGTLVAWVLGRLTYSTSVRLDADGGYVWTCSCSHGDGACKHAVAVVLAAVERTRAGGQIPLVDVDDDQVAIPSDRGDDWPGGQHGDDRSGLLRLSPTNQNPVLRNKLAALSHAELVDIMLELHQDSPRLRQMLERRAGLDSGMEAYVRRLRRQITTLSRERVWLNSWKGDGHTPDYRSVCNQFRVLSDSGQVDSLVALGGHLWTRCQYQLEQADDDGETASLIEDCLAVVVDALPRSGLSPADRVRWVLERSLEDDFGLLGPVSAFLDRQHLTTEQWAEVSGWLRGRLAAVAPGTPGWSYQRQTLTGWLVRVLRAAGLDDQIVPLLEDEARQTHDYERLVETLLSLGQTDKALAWSQAGFEKICAALPGMAAQLHRRLQEMAFASHQPGLGAAYVADAFFDRPSMNGFEALRQTSLSVGCWDQVRACVLDYLATGSRSDIGDKEGVPAVWPLPAPAVRWPLVSPRQQAKRFPDFAMLIEIALAENRADDAVRINEQRRRDAYSSLSLDLTVAAAVASSHPQVALDIWLKKAQSLIALVKPRAYVEAVEYLQRMRTVYEATSRMEEWVLLLANLRRQHKPKRRLMEELDAMERGAPPV